MTKTLYERMGGQNTLYAAVDIFYRKVLTDPRVNYFFKGIDMDRLAHKQQGFLTMAFGGPKHTGKSIREAHRPLLKLGLNDTHVDIILEHLKSTLEKLGIDTNDANEAIKIVDSYRNDVLNKKKGLITRLKNSISKLKTSTKHP